MTRFIPFVAAFVLCSIPYQALACATGCTMFDVSTSGVLPGKPGSTVWLEHSYTDQDHNKRGASHTSDTLNEHKKIRTNAYQAGVQYMFDRAWGIKATAPVIDRHAVHEDAGILESSEHIGIGDVRVTGIYSGLSPDMTTGLTFGLKLPTGSIDDSGFDRDVAIGTGSTDLLLGGYHIGQFHDTPYGWFVNGQWAQPLLTRGDYRPGAEVTVTTGTYYKGWRLGHVKITPVMQINAMHHWKDSGSESHPDDSGYTRFQAAPGVEFDFGRSKLYMDVAVPVYEHMRGNQLVAPVTVKSVLSFGF